MVTVRRLAMLDFGAKRREMTDGWEKGAVSAGGHCTTDEAQPQRQGLSSLREEEYPILLFSSSIRPGECGCSAHSVQAKERSYQFSM